MAGAALLASSGLGDARASMAADARQGRAFRARALGRALQGPTAWRIPSGRITPNRCGPPQAERDLDRTPVLGLDEPDPIPDFAVDQTSPHDWDA